MKAYKGFKKDLTCLGYKFNEDGINKTDQANCRKNGFHCAENPMDCLDYYSDRQVDPKTGKTSRAIMEHAGCSR